jgi:integral membrane protein (TIGR00529 family)
VSAFLALAGGLAACFVLLRRRIPMAIAFGAGALALVLLRPDRSTAGTEVVRGLLGSPSVWAFGGLVYAVSAFAVTLRRTGFEERLVRGVATCLASPRLQLAALPAAIGLLPMPGGALVSAPLLDAVPAAHRLEPGRKNTVNYWFRHVWEVFWPLYPSVLLAASFSGRPLWLFCTLLAPAGLVMAVAGWWFLLRPAVPGVVSVRAQPRPWDLVSGLVPIAGVVVGAWLFGAALPDLPAGLARGHLGLALAALLASGLLLLRAGRAAALSVLRGRGPWSLGLAAVGVQIFAEAIAASGAARGLAAALGGAGLPLLALAVLLPFLAGVAMGNTLAAVSASFPVVAAAAAAHPASNLPHFVAAYAAAFLGYMVSPVHLCFVLSSRFFREPLLAGYRLLGAPLLVMAAASAATTFCILHAGV